MGSRLKVLLVVLVLAGAGILLLRAYIGPRGEVGFAVTDNPGSAIQAAVEADRPLYIEFYSEN